MDFDPSDLEPWEAEPSDLDAENLDVPDLDAATFIPAKPDLDVTHRGFDAMIAIAIAIVIGVMVYCFSVVAGKPSVLVGLLGAAFVFAAVSIHPTKWFNSRYRFAHVRRDAIVLMHHPFSHLATIVPTDDVSLVVGEFGLSFEGGSLLVWKRVALTTSESRYVLTFDDPNINAAAYRHIIWLCPRAVGISATGELYVSQQPPGVHAMNWLSDAGEIVRRELRRQVRRAALFALVMLACCALSAALVVAVFSKEIAAKPANFQRGPESLAKPLIFSGIGAVVSGGFALRRIRHARRIQNALQELIESAWRRPHEPFAGATVAIAPPASASASGPTIWAWMGVAMCVLLMCVPIFGVGLNLIALIVAKNSSSVIRRIVVACLLVSILLTTGLLFIAWFLK